MSIKKAPPPKDPPTKQPVPQGLGGPGRPPPKKK